MAPARLACGQPGATVIVPATFNVPDATTGVVALAPTATLIVPGPATPDWNATLAPLCTSMVPALSTNDTKSDGSFEVTCTTPTLSLPSGPVTAPPLRTKSPWLVVCCAASVPAACTRATPPAAIESDVPPTVPPRMLSVPLGPTVTPLRSEVPGPWWLSVPPVRFSRAGLPPMSSWPTDNVP